ncbi:unnamed protein product [Fusarium graminearum]|nr:unnamed protein product [Fusarium graminearum]
MVTNECAVSAHFKNQPVSLVTCYGSPRTVLEVVWLNKSADGVDDPLYRNEIIGAIHIEHFIWEEIRLY